VSLSLYDVLDVEPDATEDEIRAAWKSAIADLGPGDRRFRAYNDAAEVLLDPVRRAAYDAEQPEPPVEPEPPVVELVETPEEPEPPVVEPVETPEEPEPPVVEPVETPEEPEPPVVEPVETPADPEPEPEPVVATGRTPIATWLLAAVGLVAAAVLAVTILVWANGRDDDKAPLDTEKNAAAALTAAEKAAVPVLSYDYRTFDAGIADAESYMTTKYAAAHSKLMNELRKDATSQKAVVQAEFKGSAIVRVTDDRADILVLINQVIHKADADDFVLPVWATLQMVQEDGTWRVDSIVNEGAVGS
jgi:Mce-associated membrane protein